MRKAIILLSAAFLVSLLVTTAVPAGHTAPSVGPGLNSIWLAPSEINYNVYNASVGTLFNVTVWANMENGTFDWEVELYFNPSLVQEVEAGYTAGATSAYFAGHQTVHFLPNVDNVEGSVLDGESLLGTDYAPQNNASLMWIEFKVVSVPNATTTSLTGTFDINNTYTFFDNYVYGTPIPSTTYDATYSFTYVNVLTNVIVDRTWVYQGQTASINVTVRNGDLPEDVWVTVYYDVAANKRIGAYPVHLEIGQSYTFIFFWNTADVPCLNYTLTAVATIRAGGSNTLSDGKITVRLIGDVNGDGRVDLRDIAL